MVTDFLLTSLHEIINPDENDLEPEAPKWTSVTR
jgi:hypothetical protein